MPLSEVAPRWDEPFPSLDGLIQSSLVPKKVRGRSVWRSSSSSAASTAASSLSSDSTGVACGSGSTSIMSVLMSRL